MSEQLLAHPACSQSHVCQSNGHFCPSVLRQLYDAVLLVDDNAELLGLMAKVLSGRYRVATARDGQEALDDVLTEPEGWPE